MGFTNWSIARTCCAALFWITIFVVLGIFGFEYWWICVAVIGLLITIFLLLRSWTEIVKRLKN